MPILEAQNVTKIYGSYKALNGLNVQVEEGSVFALLGPNGAGKTTFMKCALGLVNPDSGRLFLQGRPSLDAASRELVAYLPEKFTFFGFETPLTALNFLGRLRGVQGDLAGAV